MSDPIRPGGELGGDVSLYGMLKRRDEALGENNRLSSSAPEVGHAPPRDPARPLGCRPDPGSPEPPPKPNSNFCLAPILCRQPTESKPVLLLHAYWRGCGRCESCRARRRIEQMARGRR